MSVSMLMEVRPFGLAPVADWDLEQKNKFPVGCTVRVTISKSKSRPALHFYWAIVEMVGKATGIGKYPLSEELLYRTGFVNTAKHRNGAVVATPKSIGDMPHEEFMDFMDAALELICAEYVAISRGELVAQIEKMLKTSYEKAMRHHKKQRTIH